MSASGGAPGGGSRPDTLSSFPVGPTPHYLPVVPPGTNRLRRAEKIAIVVAICGASAILVLVGVLSASSPFAFDVPLGGCAGHSVTVAFPIGSDVNFRWATTQAASATVNVIAPLDLNESVYTGSGTSGSGSFTADNGQYQFNSSSCDAGVAEFTGSYIVGLGLF
jgi:hypothetical protein